MLYKFRVWNRFDKVMIDEPHSMRLVAGEMKSSEDDILMQFTGLTDKNGVEVFDGDLMQNKSGRICKVVWHEYAGCWDAEVVKSVGDSIGGSPNKWRFHMEVIGNIHMHPELMEPDHE